MGATGTNRTTSRTERQQEQQSNSIKSAVDIILSNNYNDLSFIENYANQMEIGKAKFTANGNSIQSQWVTIEDDKYKVDIKFGSMYNPQQVTKPTNFIKSEIEATIWENGNAKAIRKLLETKTKSLKNAKKQYEETLKQWKKLTKQKSIKF